MKTMDQVLEQTQCDFWWLPPDVNSVAREEIAYTHSSRPEKLYNSVVRIQKDDVRTSALVTEVGNAHTGGPSEWRVAAPSLSDQLERCLENNGYHLNFECRAFTICTDAKRPTNSDHIVVRHVQTEQGIIDQYAVQDLAFDRQTPLTATEIAHHLANSTGAEARTHRFVAYDRATGAPLCSASFNSFPRLGFGFLWGGGTIPSARGQGAYSAIMTARMRHAHALGLRNVGLYAITTTSAPIVAAQGFEAHGPVRCWLRPRS